MKEIKRHRLSLIKRNESQDGVYSIENRVNNNVISLYDETRLTAMIILKCMEILTHQVADHTRKQLCLLC